jgi:hypothetical protein
MSHTNPPSPGGFGGASPSAPGRGAHDADYLHNPEVAHEHSDINVRTVLGFAITLFVVVVGVCFLMAGVFKVLERQAAKNDPALSPLTRPAVQMPASQVNQPVFGRGSGSPQLLISEPSVLLEQRTREQQSLATYGWIDEKAGVARIPIDEAKKLIVQRGLPARADATDSTLGTRRSAYGESSSGRIITSQPPQQQTTGEQPPPEQTTGEQPPAAKGHGQ